MLRDFGGQPLSVVLWQAAREVVLWRQATVRAGLFAPDAHRKRLGVLRDLGVTEDVAALLRRLSEAVLMEPEVAEADHVAGLCRQVSEWAMEVGADETALWYAQAAAMALPAHAQTALATGSAALRLGKLQRAESWFLRTVAVARKREWRSYALAYFELARLSELRGDRTLARHRLMMVLRAGRRAALPSVRGKALLRLMRLALDEGSLDDAARYARAARNHIEPDHPDCFLLHADFAAIQVRAGESARALSILRDAPAVSAPERRMYLLAIEALAHARDGNQSGALADVWTTAWGLAIGIEAADLHLRTFLALAEAARASGNVRNAQRAEEAARQSARSRLDSWLIDRYAAGEGGGAAVGTLPV